MAKKHDILPTDDEAKSTNWVAVCGTAVVMMAVGLAVGFVFGTERGKASNAANVLNANKTAADATEMQKAAETKLAEHTVRFNQLVALQKSSTVQYEEKLTATAKESAALKTRLREATAKIDGNSAEKKAIDEEAKRKISAGEADQNDLVLDFIDKPAKFQGQELTMRVRFGPRPGSGRRIEYNLKRLVESYAEAQADGAKRTNVGFYGTGRAGANLDLVVWVSPTIDLPAAQLDDPVLVTFKCGTSATNGNVATRVVRPAK